MLMYVSYNQLVELTRNRKIVPVVLDARFSEKVRDEFY